jgi:phosphoglycerate dehydrogenase-like enzyme
MSVRISVLSSVVDLRNVVWKECSRRAFLADKFSCGHITISDNIDDIDSADVVIADPAKIAPIANEHLKSMKWLQSTFAGVNLLMATELRRDYVLSRIGRGFAEQMAEYTMGWILAHHLRVPETIINQSNCEWNTAPYTQRGILKNKVVGVLGAGEIGTGVAKAAKAFGMDPIGYVRSVPAHSSDSTDIRLSCAGDTRSERDGVFSFLSAAVDEVLSRSDIVINCLPSTPATRQLLSLPLLQATCETRRPLFINIGRGDVISSEALLAAAELGLFSRCVLDVVETEPLPPHSPLWSHPAVTITPHISALSYPELVAEVFADNLERFVRWQQESAEGGGGGEMEGTLGNGLLYVVDWNKGY